jgi:hypothetical protein
MLGLLTAFFAVSGIVLWVFLLALLVAVLQIRQVQGKQALNLCDGTMEQLVHASACRSPCCLRQHLPLV